jgi:hypothetical protein
MRDNFPLYERFADLDYGALPLRELDLVRDVDPCLSRLLWTAWVSRGYFHLSTIPASARQRPLADAPLEWGKPTEAAAIIANLLGDSPPSESAVITFWSPQLSVVTNYATFVKYIDDFWYPSDDNNVLVLLGKGVRLEYGQELVFLHPIGQLTCA